MVEMSEKPLTVRQVAEYLQVSPKHVYEQIKKKQLLIVRVGKAMRVTQAELKRYLLASMPNN